jgi:uncharacterized protein (TIGR02118 family)
MVKLFAFLRRREGTTHEEFVAHWQERHGPLIRDTPELARHIVRYEQHRRHHPGQWSGNEDLDGVAVQWFDGLDGFRSFLAEPKYAELIAPDERRFLDMSRVEFVICDEPNVVIGGPAEAAPVDGDEANR